MKLSIITATYNRPTQLASTALQSIQSQTDCNFEWIVINDGANSDTRDIITNVKKTSDFSVTYIEMEHVEPSNGFSLCYARNLGLDIACGDIISYLDDDNSIAPSFVTLTRQYFQQDSSIRYSIPRQNRRRDVTYNTHVIRQGKPFISPSNCCNLQQLIWQQEIFDSNGFVHNWSNAPRWNPQFKVFADYEYLLQCACRWGQDSFGFFDHILVDYIQSSNGIIGSSNYEEWSTELSLIIAFQKNYSILQEDTIERLKQIMSIYSSKAEISLTPRAFVLKENDQVSKC
ncbi:glycosyltransferase family 2 protein [Komarekiella sp. 'clone 1']|uniref:Glycosyltransferase family 2 protein n=1 Tax=Komarekiella delphini-convector SJRDD-AB1 TaxID=2593771 RepID=A0AA40VV89_9NOST|nr:glycosyltransferase family A protein [Komarekiella delphini-convector]MBD6620671.1 glycosyltransferase family 2 protein [Komarekiella delphini-convector SJRDD-AB1]